MAIENFQKSLKLKNDEPKTYMGLSEVYYKLGIKDKAIDILKDARRTLKDLRMNDKA